MAQKFNTFYQDQNKKIIMSTIENIFKLIKEKRTFLKNIKDYKIKISNSNNFERDNLIGIYKIRRLAVIRDKNQKLLSEIDHLILNLENYSENKLSFITVLGEGYYGMFYFSQSLNEIIGYIENEIDKDESGSINEI